MKGGEGIMGDSFIGGVCKVEFLCYAGEPNWLGWVFLVGGGILALFLALILLSIIFDS